jgi:hypothetical protein
MEKKMAGRRRENGSSTTYKQYGYVIKHYSTTLT